MAKFREDTKMGYPTEGSMDAVDDFVTEPDAALAGEIDDELIGMVVGARFKIARALGSGTMARVYVAEQISMQRNVAVKFLHPELLVDETAEKRFRQEVDAVSRLSSPHTIRFYDAGRTSNGWPYIVMELLVGETLREKLERTTTIDRDSVLNLVTQICASLQEAHEAGVYHRDLKPENIYLCHFETPFQPFVKLLDFGLAKLLDASDESNPMLTGAGQTVGTPAYMAPEMVVEERPVDYRCDLYTLGVIVFEMLTGRRPFDEKHPMKMALAHVQKPVPSAYEIDPSLPVALDEFFQSAMAKDPSHRPQSAALFSEALVNAFTQ